MAAADPWSGYWQADRLHSCIAATSPADERELSAFWAEFARSLDPHARVLDLATGNGAVALALLEAQPDLVITAIDKAAINPERHVRGRPLLGRVHFVGGVDLAGPLPLDGRFDAVTSQFGIEYAGFEAAGRVLADTLEPGGRFQWLLHHADSAVVTPMAANRQELEQLLAAGGILENLAAFAGGRLAGPQLRRAISAYVNAPVRRTRRISGQLLASVEQLITHAEQGSIATPAAVLISRVRAEHERLRQLEAAALGATDFARLAEIIEQSGVRLSRREALVLGAQRGDPATVGWVLCGRRQR